MTSTMNDLYTPLQRLSTAPLRQPRGQTTRPFTSFYIKDILGSKIDTNEISDGSSSSLFRRRESWSGPQSVQRPRLTHQRSTEEAKSAKPSRDNGDSPLNALEQLANKTFTGPDTSILRAAEAATTTATKRDALSLINRQQPRKKRKSRTAFSNHQIFELERRFLYQKYLTPADRDDLASTLGLTNAQVITWFQNRRAKLKRDIDELKNDVRAATVPNSKTEDSHTTRGSLSGYDDHEEEGSYTGDSMSELMSPLEARCEGHVMDDQDKMSVHYVDSDNEEDADTSIPKSSPSPPDEEDINVDDDDDEEEIDAADGNAKRTE
ncbi:uncharacterized protein [Diadema antillarum]|uniref:uncharacterized protein n=1 Tax=Diadema antillarum TaxID=105358 RepID=UPI003A8C63C6